jgi:cell fate (sporulation/competence/biofilm development) regulator YlbF (YheA/YmcA/DUF963 family)
MTTTTTEDTIVLQKTRELCRTIIEQPEFRTIRGNIDAFMADDEAKAQYQTVVEKGEYLQQKQQMGMPLDNNEIAEFEKNREALVNNPVAKAFLDAQNEIHKMQESVGQYVSKTFELGRLPNPEDFESSCGSGCGCH